MSICRALSRLAGATAIAFSGSLVPVDAQSAPSAAASEQDQQAPPGVDEHAGHDMGSMARDGSGTSWLPDETPMYAVHRLARGWMLMGHGNVFVQYLHDGGARGSSQAGSTNWIMGMASRPVGSGRLALRGMTSLEPWTIRGCGYPDLLASGEVCRGAAIHDRQHPHDLVMELAAEYDRPLARGVRVQVYGAPVGEPALGPVAFMHRISAMPNPLAPITHHWLDATHVSFGVVTGALYGGRWKAEASRFNGREPDETRTNFDFAALDSWSARMSFLPDRHWALQVSGGHLAAAETAVGDEPRVDVNRVTASAIYHRAVGDTGLWANTIGWGRNAESGGESTNALLLETSLTLRDRNTWFGRFEAVDKTAHDLAVTTGSALFTVAKAQGGYTRYFRAWRGFNTGLGATLSAGIVPKDLVAAYGGRVNAGAGVFVTFRPAASAGAAAPDRRTMVPTAINPAALMCTPPVTAATASKTVYNGTTYYFCSPGDLAIFLKDPAMNAAMMRKP